jgi:hypothetical protein
MAAPTHTAKLPNSHNSQAAGSGTMCSTPTPFSSNPPEANAVG